MAGKKEWVDRLARDLLQRQVDTILTEGITGRGMPHLVIALLDINNSYLRKLRDLQVVSKDNKDWPEEAHDADDWLLPGVPAMKWLSKKAGEALHDPRLKGRDRCIVQRICATYDTLIPIVAQLPPDAQRYFTRESRESHEPLPPFELNREERQALSKAWELGTDTVAMQSVIMIDGDIITRVNEQYATEAHVVIRQIHAEAVDVSMTTWELLAKSVRSFADLIFGRNGSEQGDTGAAE